MSRETRIYQTLSQTFNPTVLVVENETHRHQVPADAESHFKITLVTEQFDSLSRIARHRAVNEFLQAEFKQGLHALSLQLFSPKEWALKGPGVANPPPCRGGSQHEN